MRAKLFAIIAQQGKTSAATALFKSRHQVEALESVSWKDIEWYVTHPSRSSISGMYSGLGFPERSFVEGLERWVKAEAPAGHEKKLLSSITGMQNSRGAPSEEDLYGLKSWCLSHAGTDRWRLLLSHVAARQEGCAISETTELDVLAAFRRNSDTEPPLGGSRA